MTVPVQESQLRTDHAMRESSVVSELHVGCRVQRMHLVVPHARDDHTKCACVYGTAVQPKSSHC